MGELKIMGKQKSPSSIPPGGFCFPTVRYTINNRIFISRWFITVILENVAFPDEAIRGLDFFSARVDSFPYLTSGQRPRVIGK